VGGREKFQKENKIKKKNWVGGEEKIKFQIFFLKSWGKIIGK
jgi:hypothetical protein